MVALFGQQKCIVGGVLPVETSKRARDRIYSNDVSFIEVIIVIGELEDITLDTYLHESWASFDKTAL